MKKSTLITTIAMIVVVVVALSTATYAWFSASQTTQTTQTISTQAESGITVLTNSTIIQTIATDTAVFDATEMLSKTYKVSSNEFDGLRKGLWAPKGTIVPTANTGVYPTANNATATKVGGALVNFISGQQDNAKTTFTIETPCTGMSPDLIRVTNNTAGSLEHVYLNVYIAAKDNMNSYYAAQGLSFVVIKYNDGTAGTAVYNTAYGYLKSTAEHVDVEGQDKTAAEEAGDTYAISTDFDSQPASAASTYNHRVTTTDPGTGWNSNAISNAPEAVQAALSGTNNFYCISVDLGSLGQGASMNYLLYSWLDGTYLEDAAKNATIAMVYSFASKGVSELGVQQA